MKKEVRVWLDEVSKSHRAYGKMSDEYRASLTERLELHITELKTSLASRGKKSDYKSESAYKDFCYDAIIHQINSIRWCRAILEARKETK